MFQIPKIENMKALLPLNMLSCWYILSAAIMHITIVSLIKKLSVVVEPEYSIPSSQKPSSRGMAQWQGSRLVFERCSVRISAGILAVSTELFVVFRSSSDKCRDSISIRPRPLPSNSSNLKPVYRHSITWQYFHYTSASVSQMVFSHEAFQPKCVSLCISCFLHACYVPCLPHLWHDHSNR
jgi:hypothetical protein